MKKISLLFLLPSVITLLNSCALFRPEMKVVNQVPLSAVFGQVVDQFQQAQTAIKGTDIGGHTITITSANVTFDNVVTDAQNASLSLLIFRGGYSRSKTKETTVTYSLQAVPEPKASAFASRSQTAAQNSLRNLIVGSFNQFVAVSVPKDAGYFEKSISINVAFTVNQNGSIEVSGPVSTANADVSLSRNVANTHSVSIQFTLDKGK